MNLHSERSAAKPFRPPLTTTDPSRRVVYGLHAVAELLRSPHAELHALFVAHDDSRDEGKTKGAGGLKELCQESMRKGVRPVERSRSDLDALTRGGVHQGVVALCGSYHYADGIPELLERAAGVAPLFLVLDGVTDPQNLGALVRSAYVLGGHGVILPKDRAAPITAAAVKASAGATELLPIAQVANLVRAMEELRAHEVWLLAAVATNQGGQPPWACDLTQPSALVLGSEGHGLRPLVRKSCDLRVAIPMQGGLRGASLNVAAAGTALLYEALRQRQASS